MTPDTQEALSRIHYARRVLHLESGRYAVFALNLLSCEIVDDPRECDLTFHPPKPHFAPSLNEIVAALQRKEDENDIHQRRDKSFSGGNRI